MSFRRCSLLTLIGIALVISVDHQVDGATYCYFCESMKGKLCDTDSTKSAVKIDCAEFYEKLKPNSYSNNSTVLNALSSNQTLASGTLSYDCAKFEAKVGGNLYVSRFCAIEQLSCDVYKDQLALKKIELVDCQRCNSDYCNSSSNLNAGIFTSIVTAAIVLILSKQ